MKTYCTRVNVYGEDRLHVITANNKEHLVSLLKEFWFNDPSLKINEINEISECEVLITKEC